MPVLNQFVLYALLCGAGLFIAIWAWQRDVGISWWVSVGAAVLVIWRVFPDPTPAKTLGDIFGNLSLVILKALLGVAWLAGSAAVHFLVKDRR
ncbi:hypothetical protein [Desulfuromonas thiophila]|uniref:hypothetical protein n=1 Tax=Desulfuromonas thiophila TaxID=57664 RepID=UPI000B85FB4F|nr:hypothetical protein [Desulfuromonas thiophila]